MLEKCLKFALFIIVFIGFSILLNFLYSTFITGSEYQFNVGTDILTPVTISLIIGYTLFFYNKKK